MNRVLCLGPGANSLPFLCRTPDHLPASLQLSELHTPGEALTIGWETLAGSPQCRSTCLRS